MARILSFRVEGLAGRDHAVSKTLQEDVNVFFGINGSGKTTLLKILHSALSTDTSILEGLPFKSAEVEIYLNRYESVFTRRIEQKSLRPEDIEAAKSSVPPREKLGLKHILGHAVEAATSVWASDPEEPEGGRLTRFLGGYLPITRLYRTVGTQSSGTKAMSEDELDSRFAAAVQRRWTEYQGSISNKVSEAQGEGLAQILHMVLSGEDESTEPDTALEISDAYQRVASFLDRQTGFEEVLDSREEFEMKYRTKPRIKNVVKQIDLVEKKIEEVIAPRHRFQTLIESMYSGNKRIIFAEKEITIEVPDKTKIRLPALSSGEKQLFFISLEAIDSGNSSLIIDEPELSMHVDWQKKLVGSLRVLNPRMQLIMATHSPEIMADLTDEKIFSL
jgi:ABC-type cobalamin/Fe3+-siderophores transport system ATPase subunit